MALSTLQLARLKEIEGKEKQRAYSVISVKEMTENDEAWTLKGIASTPRVDRVEDIIDPEGAVFELPLPLLLQHDGDISIGRVVDAKASSKSIRFEAKIPKVKEAGSLKDDIERVVQEIKYGLRAAVSIGFRPLKDGWEWIEETGGILWKAIEWLELSVVVIPANPDARITSLKSLDDELRAALGAKRPGVVRLGTQAPGASGRTAAPSRRKDVRTIKEQIAAFEAKRAASAAALQDLVQKSADKGESLNEEEKGQFDDLELEVTECDEQIKRLKVAEKLNVEKATAASDGGADDPTLQSRARIPAGSGIRVKSDLPPGIRFARMAMCVARAKYMQKEGRFMAPEDIYRSERRWMDTAPEVVAAMKSAINADDSTTSGAASEWAYAQNIASEFIEYLRPMTLVGRITGWRSVPFNVRVGGMDAGSTGYWVGQGLAVPASKPTSTSVSLGITKVGGICVITKELAMLSTPSAEAMVRNDLARALQQKLDTSLIDPNSGGTANVQPASLTYAATPRQASGTDYAAFKADWKAMTSNFYAANIPLAGAVCIMKEELAEALSMMVTSLGLPQFPSMQDWANGNGRLMGHPVFATQVADTSGSPDFDNMLILLQPGEVFLADDGGASVEASDQVSIEMDNAPSSKSTATATGASLVSMFQTESVAIKGIRHINWTKARTQACQFIRTAAYV